jgi:hypothetical protein
MLNRGRALPDLARAVVDPLRGRRRGGPVAHEQPDVALDLGAHGGRAQAPLVEQVYVEAGRERRQHEVGEDESVGVGLELAQQDRDVPTPAVVGRLGESGDGRGLVGGRQQLGGGWAENVVPRCSPNCRPDGATEDAEYSGADTRRQASG